MSTDLRAHLDRLDTALAAGTPGPWEHEHEDYGDEWWFGGTNGSGQEVINGAVVTDAGHAADAALIVAAVNALPGLLAAVRAAADLAAELAAKCPPGDWGSGGIDDAIQADVGRGFLRILAVALPEGATR